MNTQDEILLSIAGTVGTPTYVYFEDSLISQYQALSNALRGHRHLICFAVKANSNLSILKLLSEQGSGFDIVSEGELRRVIQAGGDTSKTVFAGVGKTKSEIAYALSQNVRFLNVESKAELLLIEDVARSMQKTAPISFRVNPDVNVDTHPYLTTGLKTSKFGIPTSEVHELWESVRTSPHLSLVGLDCHIGSQITDVAPFRQAYSQLVALAKDLAERGAPMRYVDFGGGFGVSYSGKYSPMDLLEFGRVINEVVRGSDFEIIMEPGKFLAAEAGVLLTRVVYTKGASDNRFVIVDAGMNDLIRPSLYGAYHAIEVVGASDEEEVSVEVDVVGPVCESGCFLAKNRALPPLGGGELLKVLDAGAYGFVMASHYNSRRLPAEVLVKSDGSFRVIRRRDTYEQLWANEVLE